MAPGEIVCMADGMIDPARSEHVARMPSTAPSVADWPMPRTGFFFSSSRRRHTRSLCAWSSDVCSSDLKIITVEEPIEYQMTGINQVQVNPEIGMTFPAALRSILRQAPNVIMIGEIRDLETANIAMASSLTGHLVFSTLHTNDAPSAVARLVDIGVQPFLVASSVRAIMAQRLVRRLCSNCKEPAELSETELRALRIEPGQLQEAQVMKPVGCDHCRHTG